MNFAELAGGACIKVGAAVEGGGYPRSVLGRGDAAWRRRQQTAWARQYWLERILDAEAPVCLVSGQPGRGVPDIAMNARDRLVRVDSSLRVKCGSGDAI